MCISVKDIRIFQQEFNISQDSVLVKCKRNITYKV